MTLRISKKHMPSENNFITKALTNFITRSELYEIGAKVLFSY